VETSDGSAPMAGVTDTVFRRFIRHASLFSRDRGSGVRDQGSGVEELVSNQESGCGIADDRVHFSKMGSAACENPSAAVTDLLRRRAPHRRALFGSNPATLADAARIVEETGFDLVDLNLGCPAKRVVGSNGGFRPVARPARIGEIFRAVRKRKILSP